MKLAKISVGYIEENCYIYCDDQTKEAVVIDPGDEASKILSLLKKMGANVVAILLTHGHYDHIGACLEIKKHTNCIICAGKKEDAFIKDNYLNGLTTLGRDDKIAADRLFVDGEVFEFAGGRGNLKVIETPGHTGGGVCYLDEEAKVLFTGDTLFKDSVGRTDFPTGSLGQLRISLKTKLYLLDKEVVVYPGHGDETTIGHEMEFNPYVRNCN